MPGAPSKASTSKPESSAKARSPVKSANARAFLSAFSSNVLPSSITDGGLDMFSSERIRSGRFSRNACTSANFPGFVVATKSSITLELSGERSDNLFLSLEQLFDALFGKLRHSFHLFSRERSRFGGALNFNEFPRTRHNKIHCAVGPAVFLVTQIQEDLAFDDPDAHRRHGVFKRIDIDDAAVKPTAHRVRQRHVGARDRRRARAAVRLNHVAIDPDGFFAKSFQIGNRAQAAADQALNLVGPAADFSARRFSADARLRRTRQHAVLSSDPAFAAVA